MRWVEMKGITLQSTFFGKQTDELNQQGQDGSLQCSQEGNSDHAEKAKKGGLKAILEEGRVYLLMGNANRLGAELGQG